MGEELMRYTTIILLSLALIVLVSCASKSKQPILKSDENSNVILVAILKGSDSGFKNVMIDSLKTHVEPQYAVRKMLVGKADELQGQSYRLLIVMDQLKAWLVMNGQMKKIRKYSDKNSAIFFMTAGDEKWQWKNKDIHHIASASERSLVPAAWQKLKASVDEILK